MGIKINTVLDSKLYLNLIGAGISNLSLYKDAVNELNVFPVPDGDTGTNMLVTLKNALSAVISIDSDDLSFIAEKFAYNIILGARGNSGVILSQFLKGFSESFKGKSEDDLFVIANALQIGVENAYHSVANPTEGTMLTVLREASFVVNSQNQLSTINEIIDIWVEESKKSLENTPNLLPILKKAGVVDSGGAGIVYFFEGMQKYLNGDNISEPIVFTETENKSLTIDYSLFNSKSEFVYGYCTECLLQLTDDKNKVSDLDFDAFNKKLYSYGESIVTSYEKDKIKIHIHTKKPENILTYLHQFGEFLSLKIENMSVQHSEITNEKTNQSPHLKIESKEHKSIGVVAVSPEGALDSIFESLNVDFIFSLKNNQSPSANDFINAYRTIDADYIIVFPNEKSSHLTVEQSIKLSKMDNVYLIPTKNPVECYTALTMLDCESNDIESTIELLKSTIKNATVLTVTKAIKDCMFGDKQIKKDDYISLISNDLICTESDLKNEIFKTIKIISEKEGKEVVTIFTSGSYNKEIIGEVQELIHDFNVYIDIGIMETDNESDNILISFE